MTTDIFNFPAETLAKAKPIQLLICDVDGVLTNGAIIYDDTGREYKSFHAQDGVGIKLVQHHGIAVAIITSRSSPIITRRMEELKVRYVMQGQKLKLHAYEQLKQELNIMDNAIAYVGDDLPDVPVMQRVGLSIAVANANSLVKKHAHWQTTREGGNGAVREVCDLLLFAQARSFEFD